MTSPGAATVLAGDGRRRGRAVLIAHLQTVDPDALRRLAGAAAGRHGLDLLRVDVTTDSARVGARLQSRSTRTDARLQRHRRHLELRTLPAAPVDLDGDDVHPSSSLTVSVEPAAQVLRVLR